MSETTIFLIELWLIVLITIASIIEVSFQVYDHKSELKKGFKKLKKKLVKKKRKKRKRKPKLSVIKDYDIQESINE